MDFGEEWSGVKTVNIDWIVDLVMERRRRRRRRRRRVI
jgi:hypothetical protein